MRSFHFSVILLLSGSMAASAHLGALTTPKSGDSFRVGATVNVKWAVSVAHDGQDLAYSTDGKTWKSITTGLGKNAAAYAWTVPAGAVGTKVRLRVCQRAGGSGCTDTHNTSDPGEAVTAPGGSVYVLISRDFTVVSPTSVLASAPGAAPQLAFNPASRSVNLSFDLDQAGPVLLQAFDSQGRLLATLLDDRKAEGRHVLAVFSHALSASAPMVLRLSAGSRTVQQVVGAR